MILIRDAHIIDGSGAAPVRKDVLIKSDRISAIGSFRQKEADEVIEGLGCVVTPGFIDVNTDADHYLTLLADPSQQDSLLQGITTIIGGHCGASLAPLLYGSLVSVRKWADTNQVNVDWRTVAELFATLTRRGLGPNFATFVGHSTIRRDLIGEDIRDLTDGELVVLRKLVSDALADGALGLSTGLGYAHSRQVPFGEVRILAEDAAAVGGVYATHLRDEREGLLSSVTETIQIATGTKAQTYINHLRPFKGFERDFGAALELLERNRDADIRFGSYPFDTSLVPLYTLLPAWAKSGNLEIMASYLGDPFAASRIASELPPFGENDIAVAHAPGNEHLAGVTIGAFAANRSLDLPHALVELMATTRLRANVLYRNLNVDLALASFRSDRALVASNGPGPLSAAPAHERLSGAFSKFLSVVVGTGLMPLEHAIRKLTSTPARFFRIPERGLVREGAVADLVVLREGTVTDVFVSGVHVVASGAYQRQLPGKILKRA